MKTSERFENEKKVQIEKIKKQNQFLEELKSDNLKANILNSNQSTKIDDILDKNIKYIRKLESNEFEIAIVGLEKAGKSTFANALMENNILPSAPERCTFTSTRITNGNDSAIVEFYTEDEFNKIFQALLKDIEVPNYEKFHFRTLSSEKFRSYFDSLEEKNPPLHRAHVGKTDEEILDILSCRDRLILTGETKRFSAEELNSETFQAYIKGENKGKDTSKPRSVKRVEINSSRLQKLENAVIFDVPGFDSPTKIHERQTIERLKNADAIILVTNVGRNPSLVGTQLNIITSHSDSDGIPLREKLFVFGNQIDLVNNSSSIENNINVLKRDVEKYRIGEQRRVFTGSALKYLIDKNIIRDDEYRARFEFNTGIEDIYNALIHYYENERFEILKRKIENNRIEMRRIFKEIIESFDSEFDVNFVENKKNQILLGTSKTIENKLKDKLKELKAELKEEILEEKYFSNKFTNQVKNEDGNYFKKITEDSIKRAKLDKDESVTRDVAIEKINNYIRENLHSEFLQEFSNLIKMITDEKSKDIEVRILRAFCNSIVDETDSETYSKIEKESEKLIQKLTEDVAHDEGRFVYLIERFSRNIFDILILSPLFSEDRANKFREAEIEYKYLDGYYNQNKNEVNTLLNMILGGNKKLSKGKESSRSTGVSSHLRRGMNNNQNTQNDGINVDTITQEGVRSKTEEEVLKEINQDIDNLKDILSEAVTPAIGLEIAFFNSVDKQLKLLIKSFDVSNGDSSILMLNFISKIIPLIKKDEFETINEKLDAYKLQRKILDKIKEFDL